MARQIAPTLDMDASNVAAVLVADTKGAAMVVMAPKGSEQLKRYEQLKVVDYSSDSEEGNPYEIVVDGKEGKVRVLVDTTQELVDTIRRMSPRNVY